MLAHYSFEPLTDALAGLQPSSACVSNILPSELSEALQGSHFLALIRFPGS